jgi:hypothetical protein
VSSVPCLATLFFSCVSNQFIFNKLEAGGVEPYTTTDNTQLIEKARRSKRNNRPMPHSDVQNHFIVGDVLTTVAGTWSPCPKSNSFQNGRLNPIRNCNTRMFFDVLPNFDEIERGLGRQDIPRRHLRLAFQSFQMSIESIFGNSFATVELLDTTRNLRIDCVAIF